MYPKAWSSSTTKFAKPQAHQNRRSGDRSIEFLGPFSLPLSALLPSATRNQYGKRGAKYRRHGMPRSRPTGFCGGHCPSRHQRRESERTTFFFISMVEATVACAYSHLGGFLALGDGFWKAVTVVV